MGTKGFSLRQSLTDNGVTTEEALRNHLSLVYGTIKAIPSLRVSSYRPDPRNPNVINMG